jgi:hypothetical protein
VHGGATTLELARYRDGHLVAGLIDVHQPEPGKQRRTSRIVRLDDTGAREVVYHEDVFTWDFRDFHFSEREYEPYRRSDEEYDAVHELYASMLRQLPFEVEMTIAETGPAIGWIGPTLRVSDDGALWVLSGRGRRPAADGIMAVYDVFDATGSFQRQMAVTCDADGTEDALFLDDSGERAVFGAEVDTGAEPTPIEVIGYGVEAVDQPAAWRYSIRS